MRVLGVIPARGGSKGVPRKNVVPLGGRPLLAWTVEHARAARRLAAFMVSTEDEEIADVARRSGAWVPFLRPGHLAADDTPTLPVLVDVIDRLAADGDHYDAVCLLQPTTPFRAPGSIDAAIELLVERRADSVISVVPVPHEHHPDWALVDTDNGVIAWATGSDEPPPRRQDLRPAFHREGSIYVTRSEVLRAGSLFGRRIGALHVDPDRAVNIDTPADLDRAMRLVEADSRGSAAG